MNWMIIINRNLINKFKFKILLKNFKYITSFNSLKISYNILSSNITICNFIIKKNIYPSKFSSLSLHLNSKRAFHATSFFNKKNESSFHYFRDSHQITLSGFDLLRNAEQNKLLAFNDEERNKFHLRGLLPAGHHSEAHQMRLVIEQIREFRKPLNKYVYLRDLQDTNKQLFYRVLQTYSDELMPIVYTPVVGLACEHYSKIFRRPRGMFITIEDAGNISKVIDNWDESSVKAIVVTDGERILGLGDLGANGMGISVGKMALYSAIGGIPPYLTLPVCIDVGTNNEKLLNDPYYIGLHKPRVTGQAYDDLIDEFMKAIVAKFGNECLIQFEDFANHNARRLLEKYRYHYCTFNDDIQGTASVTLAGIFAANRVTGMKMSDHRFLFLGAGSAGLGIADLIVAQMISEGLTDDVAKKKIFLFDIEGLVTNKRYFTPDDHKSVFAKDMEQITDFAELINIVKPTTIIGASAVPGSFTPQILTRMAELNERPLIFALSNPTSKAECTAEQAFTYTKGRCLFASGSPFDEITIDRKRYEPSQGNNAYIFPAIALSIMACSVQRITDETFILAAKALSEEVTNEEFAAGRLYPRMKKIRHVTRQIGCKLIEWYYEKGYAVYKPEPKDKMKFIKSIQYNTLYDDSIKPNRKN